MAALIVASALAGCKPVDVADPSAFEEDDPAARRR
jgi:hypothetical protein